MSRTRGYKDLKELPPLPQADDDEASEREIDIMQMLRSGPPAARYADSGKESEKNLTAEDDENISEGAQTPGRESNEGAEV